VDPVRFTPRRGTPDAHLPALGPRRRWRQPRPHGRRPLVVSGGCVLGDGVEGGAGLGDGVVFVDRLELVVVDDDGAVDDDDDDDDAYIARDGS